MFRQSKAPTSVADRDFPDASVRIPLKPRHNFGLWHRMDSCSVFASVTNSAFGRIVPPPRNVSECQCQCRIPPPFQKIAPTMRRAAEPVWLECRAYYAAEKFREWILQVGWRRV